MTPTAIQSGISLVVGTISLLTLMCLQQSEGSSPTISQNHIH